MATEVQDDYLGCGAYQANVGNKSAAHPGFITFKESNGDHFFAWVNGDEIVMRSEAYPNEEKMERGIKAILKNCDLPERYSVVEGEGGYLLLMYGGGDHQKHTGNLENHSEIGRSCPHQSREALNKLLSFKGQDFADKVVPIQRSAEVAAAPSAAPIAAPVAAAAVAATAAASYVSKEAEPVRETTAAASSYVEETAAAAGGGMGWLKWLLPLLLLGALLWWWKGCKGDGGTVPPPVGDTPYVPKAPDTSKGSMPKVTIDSTGYINYDLGAVGDVDLCDGQKLIGIAKDGFENTLLEFIKNGTIDTTDKGKNWFTMHDVQFKTGSTEYANPKALQQVKNIVAILKCNPKVVLKLGGYTDVRGDDKMNQALSDRRAKQISKDLLAAGVPASQIKEAVGYGEQFATAAETDAEGMARDRKTSAKVASK